jgi:hypothetical protein
MPDRTDVQWLKIGDMQLLLVKRPLYDVYALMTIEEFKRTEPYVEVVSVVTKHSVTDVIRRDAHGNESYLPVNVNNPEPLFVIKKRVGTEDE